MDLALQEEEEEEAQGPFPHTGGGGGKCIQQAVQLFTLLRWEKRGGEKEGIKVFPPSNHQTPHKKIERRTGSGSIERPRQKFSFFPPFLPRHSPSQFFSLFLCFSFTSLRGERRGGM